MPPSAKLKISGQHTANTAELLSCAAVSGRRKNSDMPPPEVKMKTKFLGLENGVAIYGGIAIAAAIIIPLAHVALKQHAAWVLSHFQKPQPALIVQSTPAPPPAPHPVKIPLPPIKPDT